MPNTADILQPVDKSWASSAGLPRAEHEYVNHAMKTTLRVNCPVCQCEHSRFERLVEGFSLERCQTCSMVFMNPQYSDDQFRQLYTARDAATLAELYSRIAAASSVRKECNLRLDHIEARVPNRGRLLDFGCGNGFFFEHAQRRGWDAHGLEVGEWAAEAAAARGLKNLHIGQLKDADLADASFDVVYAAEVFEHLPRPREELHEIRRVLRRGGLLYIAVPNYQTLSIVLGRDDFMLNAPPQHVNYFTPKTLAALITSCGFDDVSTTTGGGLKWENLLGRRIRSEIQDAYGLGESGSRQPPRGAQPSRERRSIARILKSMLMTAIIRPMFYDHLQVGMGLFVAARRT